MTFSDYAKIERLLTVAEDVIKESSLLTPNGQHIQELIRDALRKTTAERLRTQLREEAAQASNQHQPLDYPQRGSFVPLG